MSEDHDPAVEVPDDVPMEDLERWEQHIWLTPDLPVRDRQVAISIVRWVRGDVPGHTEDLRRLHKRLGEVLKEQEGPDEG